MSEYCQAFVSAAERAGRADRQQIGRPGATYLRHVSPQMCVERVGSSIVFGVVQALETELVPVATVEGDLAVVDREESAAA